MGIVNAMGWDGTGQTTPCMVFSVKLHQMTDNLSLRSLHDTWHLRGLTNILA